MISCIYRGWVRHRRLTPRPHAFRYRLFMLYLDLDELAQGRVFAGRRLWSERRRGFALARFRRDDYYGDPARPLADCIRERVAADLGRPIGQGPIRLLTHIRYFGYCFNPISVYYCYAADGATLEALVAEVSNTPWGERRCYVLDVTGGRAQTFDKTLHVSPFMPMQQRYQWYCNRPAAALTIHMNVIGAVNAAPQNGSNKLFDATLALRREPLDGRRGAAALLLAPPMTFKVVAAIYWQALRLWLKRTPLFGHPKLNDHPAKS